MRSDARADEDVARLVLYHESHAPEIPSAKARVSDGCETFGNKGKLQSRDAAFVGGNEVAVGKDAASA